MKSNTKIPSLLPYLEATGAKLHMSLILNSKEPSIQEKSPFPFLSISESDPFARLIQAQFVTDAGSEIKRVFLLLQRDEYPISEDALWPISNHDIDECWQRTFSSYSSKSRDSSAVILANQIGKDGGLKPLQSLFYCKPKQIFFHPPCPRCGLTLQQCYDDHLLTSLGLQEYSTSLMRYLFCPACFESLGKSHFYAYSLKESTPPILRDRWDLIKEFGQLTEDEKHSNQFPCSHCPSYQECYGANGLAVSRIVPFSFYPFFMLIFPDRLVNAVDFLSIVSGGTSEDLERQLGEKQEFGRINCLKALKQNGPVKTPFFFDKDERYFLEVLYLKLSFLGELFQTVFSGPDTYKHPDFGLSIDKIWIKLSEQGSLLPFFWNFKIKLLGIGGNTARAPFLPKFPPTYSPHFLGTAWFFSLLVNSKQGVADVYEELGRTIEQNISNDEVSFESFLNNDLKGAFSPDNIFWDLEVKTIRKDWERFWVRSLDLGWSLLKASLTGDSNWSKEKFWQEFENLRKEIKDTLFQQGPTVAEADTVSKNKAIHEILTKLIEKWSIDFETKEDELEKTIIVSPTGGQKLDEKVTVSQEDNDLQETVIQRPGYSEKVTSTPVKPEEEDILETTIIAPSQKPSTPFSSSRRLPPEDTAVDKNVTNLEQKLEDTADTKKRKDEADGDDFLYETVILRPDKAKDKE